MRQAIARLLYNIANVCCVVADQIWGDDDFWGTEFEKLRSRAEHPAGTKLPPPQPMTGKLPPYDEWKYE